VIDAPLRWPVGEYGTHKFILKRFPFAIVYREKGENHPDTRLRSRSPQARLLERPGLAAVFLN
jgi:hypothetical protein